MQTPISTTAQKAIPTIDEVSKTTGLPLPWERLAALPFFAGFEENELKQIAPYTKISYFAPGEPILEAGDLANRFYLLLSGTAAVECKFFGCQVRVEQLGEGDAVGFSWLFTPDKLHFTARAIEPVVAVFFYGTMLREDCELFPRLGYQLLQRASQIMMRRLEKVVSLLSGAKNSEHNPV